VRAPWTKSPAPIKSTTYWSNLPLSLGLAHAALAHPVVLGDQVDRHAEERQDDHEHDPARLARAADVVAAKEVDEDCDHNPDPGHPAEDVMIVQRPSKNGWSAAIGISSGSRPYCDRVNHVLPPGRQHAGTVAEVADSRP
jgi:hypothetical protein